MDQTFLKGVLMNPSAVDMMSKSFATERLRRRSGCVGAPRRVPCACQSILGLCEGMLCVCLIYSAITSFA